MHAVLNLDTSLHTMLQSPFYACSSTEDCQSSAVIEMIKACKIGTWYLVPVPGPMYLVKTTGSNWVQTVRCSFLSCKEVRITIFLEEVFLTEGVSYKRVPYKDFQIWCSFIEKSVSYIEGVSYRECILKGDSTLVFIWQNNMQNEWREKDLDPSFQGNTGAR